MTEKKGKELLFGLMEESMKGLGKTAKCMEKGTSMDLMDKKKEENGLITKGSNGSMKMIM